MIFTELVLHNFGVYKGRHTVDLQPSQINKPIILFGGLNGGGKTTFLDALQLTIFGKFAKCSNRRELNYNDYLKEAINRHVSPEEGATLELEFHHYNEGKKTVYRIKRLWKSTGKGIKESMEVLKNNVLDHIMSEHWYEHVDDFFPINISGLFFFDGEKIENLANTESSADIIKTGIMSLLGIDLVDKLRDDLRTIERRRLSKQADRNTYKLIEEIEKEISNIKISHKKYHEEVAHKNSKIDILNRQIENAKKSYKQHGGEIYEQRELIEKQHQYNQQKLKNNEDNIRRFIEGAAPFLLVQELINKAKNLAEKEKEALVNQTLVSIIEERDSDIIAKFSKASKEKSIVEILNVILSDDRNKRENSAKHGATLNIKPEDLHSFDKVFFSKLKKEASRLKQTYEDIIEELTISDKKLSTIPEEDLIRGVAEQLWIAENNQKIAQGELNALSDLFFETDKLLSSKQSALDRLLHSENDEQLSTHRDRNILEHTREVQKTLMIYRQCLIEKHIGRLETLIKESFISLIRKSDLVSNIQISLEDFSLHVISHDEQIIPTSRLSAGERQLLAISILWGLAKASGRPLPSIIDTPLGRLDSEHRRHLIDNYFSKASHQMILLSTDTEIDAEYRNDLESSIGKEYHIQYNEKLKSSTITPGYF